jgi:hypothetical protein
MIAASPQSSLQSFVFPSLRALSACRFARRELVGRPPAAVAPKSDGFSNFETEPMRPLPLSADGRFPYMLNTADHRFDVFDAQGENLRSLGETADHLRPVAIAVRCNEARSLGSSNAAM